LASTETIQLYFKVEFQAEVTVIISLNNKNTNTFRYKEQPFPCTACKQTLFLYPPVALRVNVTIIGLQEQLPNIDFAYVYFMFLLQMTENVLIHSHVACAINQ